MPPKRWVPKSKNETTGVTYFNWETVELPKLIEPPTIDEESPPGLEGVKLTKEKPSKPEEVGGGSVRGERWFPTFIELSQPKGDRDNEEGS